MVSKTPPYSVAYLLSTILLVVQYLIFSIAIMEKHNIYTSDSRAVEGYNFKW